MIIYLMGIDGAGKSTVGVKIKQELEKSAPCDLIWARYQPRWVKMLISPFRKKSVKSSEDYNNMSAQDYITWTTSKREKLRKHPLLAKILFTLQYWEYMSQIRNVFKNKNGKHLIIDRYVLDFIVDQTINYGDISNRKWTKMLLKQIHNFDKIVFINVDSEVAFKRKSDIPSLGYLNERRSVYLQYVKMLPNAISVDNNEDIDDTMKAIYKELGL